MLTRNDLLFHLSEEFYTTEQKALNAIICFFQPFGKIKIAGSYENKPSFALQKLRRQLSFISLSLFFRNNAFTWKFDLFWNLIDFGFEKNDGLNIDWRQKEMLWKMHKMIK